MTLTTEQKVFGGIGIATVAIIVGAIVFLSGGSTQTVAKENIVAESGLHWHPKVTITIKGKKQEIPSSIGLSGQVHQELHTHDEDAKDGVVHMEMKGLVTKDETKLENFFRIWGKEFNEAQIFDKKNGADGTVTMTVNGKENTEFGNYQMRDGDQIEINYE